VIRWLRWLFHGAHGKSFDELTLEEYKQQDNGQHADDDAGGQWTPIGALEA
jgi:hypothetical protein